MTTPTASHPNSVTTAEHNRAVNVALGVGFFAGVLVAAWLFLPPAQPRGYVILQEPPPRRREKDITPPPGGGAP